MSGAKIKIRVAAVRVLDESDEASDSDEPYIIVFVADRSTSIDGVAVTSAKTTVFGPWSADEGDLLTTQGSEACWGPAGTAVLVKHPDHLIILAGVMENDNGNPTQGRSLVNSLMAGALANMAGSDLTRDEMAAQLKNDMDGALSQARMTGFPDFDDRVGPVRELRLTQADLDKAKTVKVRKNLTFNGGDPEGAYRVGFDLIPA